MTSACTRVRCESTVCNLPLHSWASLPGLTGWALISLSSLSQGLHCWPALSFHFDQHTVKSFHSFNVRNCQILLRWGQRAKVTTRLRTTALSWPCFPLLSFLKEYFNSQRVGYFSPSAIQGGKHPCCYSHVFWKFRCPVRIRIHSLWGTPAGQQSDVTGNLYFAVSHA